MQELEIKSWSAWNTLFRDFEVPVKRQYSGFVNASSNEFNSTIAQQVYDSFRRQCIADICSYPPWSEYLKQIAKALHVKCQDLNVFSGSDEFFKYFAMVAAIAGSRVALVPPFYANAELYLRMFGVPFQVISSLKKNMASTIEQAWRKEHFDILILTNPCSHFGSSMSKEQVNACLKLSKDRGIALVLDEAYWGFSDEIHSPEYEDCDTLLKVRSFSKSYGIAGLRFAISLSQSTLSETLRKLRPHNTIPSATLQFVVQLLEHDKEIAEERKLIATARDGIMHFATNLSERIQVPRSHSNFLTLRFIDQSWALQLLAELNSRKIIVKDLGKIDHLHCLRMTIHEDPSFLNAIKTSLESVII